MGLRPANLHESPGRAGGNACPTCAADTFVCADLLSARSFENVSGIGRKRLWHITTTPRFGLRRRFFYTFYRCVSVSAPGNPRRTCFAVAAVPHRGPPANLYDRGQSRTEPAREGTTAVCYNSVYVGFLTYSRESDSAAPQMRFPNGTSASRRPLRNFFKRRTTSDEAFFAFRSRNRCRCPGYRFRCRACGSGRNENA